MPFFLISMLQTAGATLAPIIAAMGLRLVSERVIRRVTVITLRYFADSTKSKMTHDLLETVAQALDVPAEVYKVKP